MQASPTISTPSVNQPVLYSKSGRGEILMDPHSLLFKPKMGV